MKGRTARSWFSIIRASAIREVDWQVDMVLTLEEGKHYMRKYLEITVPDSQRHLARLDYIDFEPMSLPEGYAVWTHPVMEQGVGGVSGYYISLGQPVYIQGMFFGLEFPASETEIEGDRKVRIRYYSGKSLLRCLLRRKVWRTAGRLPPGKK